MSVESVILRGELNLEIRAAEHTPAMAKALAAPAVSGHW